MESLSRNESRTRGQRETRPCQGCGTPITRLLTQARCETWFCGLPCQAAYRKWQPNPQPDATDTRPCGACGKSITDLICRRPSEIWGCSKSCAGKIRMAQRMASGDWKRPVRTPRTDQADCRTCGATFERNATKILKDYRFCSRLCALRFPGRLAGRSLNRGPGRCDNGSGYIQIRCDDGKWRLEHRVVMERKLGRKLLKGEQVHHLDNNRSNNDPANLEVVQQSDHARVSTAFGVAKRRAERAELAEYRRRYGLLD